MDNLNVTTEQLVFMYGELAIENRILRNEIETLRAALATQEKPHITNENDQGEKPSVRKATRARGVADSE